MELENLEIPLVVTYDNNPTENTEYFVKTLEKNKWDYVLIGKGEKWENYVTKLKGYKKFLETLNPKKIVVLSDARDVFCVRSPKAFLYYLSFIKEPMIVSMELFCEGFIDREETYKGFQCVYLKKYFQYHKIDEKELLRRYVNSGLICGQAEVLLEYLNYTIDNNFDDDQLALGMFMNQNPQKIYADIEAIILHSSGFGVSCGMFNKQRYDSPSFAEFFGRSSFFLHVPGLEFPGQKLMYDFCKKVLDLGSGDTLLRTGYKYKEEVHPQNFL